MLASTTSVTHKAGTREEYSELVRRVKAAGLLERRPSLCIGILGLTFGLYALGWFAFFVVGNSWWQLAVAVFLGIAYGQVGFLAHDSGHRQIFPNRRPNEAMMYFTSNFLLGISAAWWMGKHTKHHSNPNNADVDPDMQLRFFAYNRDQAGEKQGLMKFITRHQHILYFPLTMLEGFSLRVGSLKAMLADKSMRTRRRDLSLYTAHLLLYFVAVFATLPFAMAIAFLVVHQVVFGFYVASTFAPNHKGMPRYEESDSNFRNQVLTARNVTGGPVMSFLTGGLDHQIEHHIFPSMPRANLRKVRPIVKSFCGEIGLEYKEANVFASFREVFTYFERSRHPR